MQASEYVFLLDGSERHSIVQIQARIFRWVKGHIVKGSAALTKNILSFSTISLLLLHAKMIGKSSVVHNLFWNQMLPPSTWLQFFDFCSSTFLAMLCETILRFEIETACWLAHFDRFKKLSTYTIKMAHNVRITGRAKVVISICVFGVRVHFCS